jgi:hypothetical protein
MRQEPDDTALGGLSLTSMPDEYLDISNGERQAGFVQHKTLAAPS